MKSFQGCSLPE